MRRSNTVRPSSLIRAGLVVAVILGTFVPATTAGAAGCTIRVVAHPNTAATAFDQLYGVDALTATNVWAVGSSDAAGKPLVLHWNGKSWKIVPAPDKGSITELSDVDAITATNVWAVGYYFPTSGGHARTLVEHWNGHRWSIVPSPSPVAGADNFLKGVAAVSASNIWAVGSNGRPGDTTIIEHWNGSKWLVVPGPKLIDGGDLQDVSAISKTDVVAVGHEGLLGSGEALIERFNGHAWTQEPVSSTSGSGDDLFGVSTPSATARWAAGSRSGTSALQTLTLRDTGSGWKVVKSPNVGTTQVNIFNDISAVSATNAWAVGERSTAGGVRRTLVAHFAGGKWTLVASPNVGTDDNRLFGIAATTGTRFTAVGTASHPIGSTGLIERGC